MNTLFKKTIFPALVSVCFTVSAQDQTNELIYSTAKDATIAFTAIMQTTNGGTTRVKIGNKDIIAALNATGVFNFTNKPKLMMRSDDAAQPYFVVRDSATNETDVSAYLTVTEPDDAVHGRNQKVNWGIWNVTLTNSTTMDFTLWGLIILHTGKIPTGTGGFLERTVQLRTVASGPGHINGADAQISGTVLANHGRIDSTPISAPPVVTPEQAPL